MKCGASCAVPEQLGMGEISFEISNSALLRAKVTKRRNSEFQVPGSLTTRHHLFALWKATIDHDEATAKAAVGAHRRKYYCIILIKIGRYHCFTLHHTKNSIGIAPNPIIRLC